jgi:chromosome segregation ATPase
LEKVVVMRLNTLSKAGMVLVPLVMLAGCSGSGRTESSERAIDTMKDVRKQLTEAKGTVNKSLTAMDALNSSSDLEKSFKNFSSAVEDVEDAGADARKRWASMKNRAREYTEQWEKEADDMQSKDVRSGLTERRAQVKKNYETMTDMAHKTRDAYDPFLRDLQEIKKALSIDMSRSGVTALQPAFARAHADGQALNAQIDALNAKLGQTLSGMGTPE